jgi:hypothetical protein
MHAGLKVLMEVDDYSVLIVCGPQGILGQQLMPRPMHLLNVFNIILYTHPFIK